MNASVRGNTDQEAVWLLYYTATINVSSIDHLLIDNLILDRSTIPKQDLAIIVLKATPKSGENIQVAITFQINLKKESEQFKTLSQESNLHDLSNDYLLIMGDKHYECVSFLGHLLDYLTWRKKLHDKQHGKKIEITNCSWTLDGGKLNTYDGQGHLRRPLGLYEITIPDTVITIEDFNDYALIWESEKAPRPLHHDLLEEAEQLYWLKHYRSGYLIMCSAIEVANIRLVSAILPNTEWLKEVDNKPSLLSQYQNYINPNIGQILKESDLHIISDMIATRDNIANWGGIVESQTFYAHLQFVKLLLYQIDFHLGYNWATKKEGTLIKNHRIKRIWENME